MDVNAIVSSHIAASVAKVQTAALARALDSPGGDKAARVLGEAVSRSHQEFARHAAAIARGGIDMLA